jgi:monoamine oxidase
MHCLRHEHLVMYHMGDRTYQDEKFFQDWADLSDVCDVYHPELGPGAKEWDGITFADFAKRYSPAAESLANALSKALLGAEATQMSALYMFHYIKSGTGLRNMVSDGKDGGQYLRNRQGN